MKNTKSVAIVLVVILPIAAFASEPLISIRHSATEINQGQCKTHFQLRSDEEIKNVSITASVYGRSGKILVDGEILANQVGGGAPWEGKQKVEIQFQEKNFTDESDQYCTEDGATVKITGATATFKGKKIDLLKSKLLTIDLQLFKPMKVKL